MVPDRVESRATARLTEFLNRKNVTAGVKPVWRYFGTLPGVVPNSKTAGTRERSILRPGNNYQISLETGLEMTIKFHLKQYVACLIGGYALLAGAL